MKRIISTLFVVLFALSFVCIPASAAESFASVERSLPLVADYADIFTDAEETWFVEKCQAFTDEYKAEIAIVTVTDLAGKDVQDYADDFYDYNGYGYGENDDGLLILYLAGEPGYQKLCITTHGKALEQISDDEIYDILEAAKADILFEDYTGAFELFISMSADAIKPPSQVLRFLVCLGIGVAVGLFITGSMAASNRSVRKQHSAAGYVKEGSLAVTGRSDTFVGSRVKTTPIPKNKNSGSGSSHTSSSGRSHGGGSVSF